MLHSRDTASLHVHMMRLCLSMNKLNLVLCSAVTAVYLLNANASQNTEQHRDKT